MPARNALVGVVIAHTFTVSLAGCSIKAGSTPRERKVSACDTLWHTVATDRGVTIQESQWLETNFYVRHCTAAGWSHAQIACVHAQALSARRSGPLPQTEPTCGFTPDYLARLSRAKRHYESLSADAQRAYRAK